jgi:hypothetical protein
MVYVIIISVVVITALTIATTASFMALRALFETL